MLAMEMLEFKKRLAKSGIIFCYSGYMTEEILYGIGNALKAKLDVEDFDRKVTKAAFSIFVEQVQNVIRYSAEKIPTTESDAMRYGILSVGYSGESVFVSCGNAVDNESAEN